MSEVTLTPSEEVLYADRLETVMAEWIMGRESFKDIPIGELKELMTELGGEIIIGFREIEKNQKPKDPVYMTEAAVNAAYAANQNQLYAVVKQIVPEEHRANFETLCSAISHSKKIEAIKAFRALTYYGLKEAKEWVEKTIRGEALMNIPMMTVAMDRLMTASEEHFRDFFKDQPDRMDAFIKLVVENQFIDREDFKEEFVRLTGCAFMEADVWIQETLTKHQGVEYPGWMKALILENRRG